MEGGYWLGAWWVWVGNWLILNGFAGGGFGLFWCKGGDFFLNLCCWIVIFWGDV